MGPEVKGGEAGRELSIAPIGASKERRGLNFLFKQNLITSAMKPSCAKSEKHQRKYKQNRALNLPCTELTS